MHQPQLTEERLRFHLDGNQPMRERLCAALLPLAGPYSNVKPRRPMGGPDGGRDLEAIYDQSLLVWGGVGFQNSAHDSPEEKAWVRKKLRDDLDRALSEKPDLRGFVFFTNVDLTPAEQAALKAEAEKKGIVFVDVFYRERLRMLLDESRGLGIRFQYLGLPLSEAEQIAFFSHYGAQLEKLVAQGFESLDNKLRRIEFLHDCSKPLMGASVVVELNKQYSAEELGHVRVLAQILNMHEPDPHPGLYLAGRDSYPIFHLEGHEGRAIGTLSLAWSRNPDEQIQNTIFSAMQPTTDYLEFGAHLHKKGPFPTLGSLDQRWLSVYVTRPLLEQVRGVGISVNGYMVAGHPAEKFVTLDGGPLTEWPGELSDEERLVPWTTLMIRDPEPLFDLPGADRKGWSLNFDDYTPQKVR